MLEAPIFNDETDDKGLEKEKSEDGTTKDSAATSIIPI